MIPEKEQALKAHLEAIAAILYDEADSEALKTLEGIEVTVRQQMLERIGPQLGIFLSARRRGQKLDVAARSKAVSGS